MDLVIFMGIPGSGKSTFYKENLFRTHMRVNLDMLRTRKREDNLLRFCFSSKMPLVIDNTNVTIRDREKYIDLGKEYKYKIRGFYFRSDLKECLERNQSRTGKGGIKDKGVIAKFYQLQMPKKEEGFDELYYVYPDEPNHFAVEVWKDYP